LVIGFCSFDIVSNLSIVIWNFSAVSGKVNRFYPNQLELILTFARVSRQIQLALPIHMSYILSLKK